MSLASIISTLRMKPWLAHTTSCELTWPKDEELSQQGALAAPLLQRLECSHTKSCCAATQCHSHTGGFSKYAWGHKVTGVSICTSSINFDNLSTLLLTPQMHPRP